MKKISLKKSLRFTLESLFVGLSYMLGAWIGFFLSHLNPKQDATIWPAEGIALSFMLLYGSRRTILGIFLGAFGANIFYSSSLLSGFTIGVGNTIGVYINYWLLRKIAKIQYPLESGRSVVFLLTLGTFPGAIFSSIVGMITLFNMNFIYVENIITIFFNWFISKELGLAIVTPAILSWIHSRKQYSWSFKNTFTAIFTIGIMVFISQKVFTSGEPILFLPIPFLIYAAVRFRDIGSTSSILLLSSVSAFYTAQGVGPFAESKMSMQHLDSTLVLMDSYIVAMTGMSFLLVAVLKERETAQTAALDNMKMIEKMKDEANRELEKKVIERTRIIELQKEELEKQISIAQKIQTALLPQFIPNVDGVQISFQYLPMMKLGGDFLDIKHFEANNGICFFICDVSGHGVPAAFLASMAKMSLYHWYEKPDGVARAANEFYLSLRDHLGNHFITAVFIYLDLEKMQFKLARAGHLPALVIHENGIVDSYSPKGKVIMNLAAPNCDELVIPLTKGDTIFLYTDGVIEARKMDSSEMFGVDRLELLLSQFIQLPVNKIAQVVLDSVIDYSGSLENLEDDLSIMVIRV
jgi:serine phosphatase RsbU (regulator of sigma subunit)